jgi:hypothetical protein
VVHQQVARHRCKPGRKAALRGLVAWEGPVDAQKNFLAQILGRGRVASEPVAQIKNAPRVPPHKILPRRPIAPEAELD